MGRRGRDELPGRERSATAAAQSGVTGRLGGRGSGIDDQESLVLLEGKNAVIYGGAGAIGGAVAETFAREGAQVFLAGRTAEKLEAVAERIRAAGGTAQVAQLDALDEQAVDQHADAVAASAGRIDVSFNLISHGVVQGTPMAEMRLEDYLT